MESAPVYALYLTDTQETLGERNEFLAPSSSWYCMNRPFAAILRGMAELFSSGPLHGAVASSSLDAAHFTRAFTQHCPGISAFQEMD